MRSALWTRHASRAEVACCSRSATMFLARSISTLGTRSLLKSRDPVDQVVPPLDGVEGAGIHSPILVHLEVGIGRHEQGVVLGGLDVKLPGIQDLPRGQGLEDDIGQGDDLPQAGTAVEEVHARRGHDALVEIRAAAVVPDIIDAHVELRNPEDLGPRELRFGHPDAGLGGGHDQRPGVGEPQGRGEVDRKAKVGRLERCGLQLHGPKSLAGRGGGIGRCGRAGGNGAGDGGLGAARQRLEPMEHQGRDDDRCEAESFHRAWLLPLSPLNGTRRAADPTWRVIGFHRLITMKMLIAKAATFRPPFLSSCRARA